MPDPLAFTIPQAMSSQWLHEKKKAGKAGQKGSVSND